jgi:hypothetical protein
MGREINIKGKRRDKRKKVDENENAKKNTWIEY